MPLPDDAFELQYLLIENNERVLINTCELAHSASLYFNKKILVVIHIGYSLEYFNYLNLLERTVNFLSKAQKEYPLVEFCFENIIPITFDRKINKINLKQGGFLFDTIDLVNYLKSKGINNCGTVLDTCHALITLNYFNMLTPENLPSPVSSLEEYFKQNKDVIKLIHLSSTEGLGYKKQTHGIPYTPDNKEELKEIIRLYNKYNYYCPITLEVLETDFIIANNYEMTKKTLEEILN